jgi:hypothetical protein
VRTLAVASSAGTDNIYSHHAAAALWRIPIPGSWPTKIDVVGHRSTGGRSSEQIRRRAVVPDVEVGSIGGVRVTTPAQTAADLAHALPRIEAITAIDSDGVIGQFDGLITYAAAIAVDARRSLVREKVREDRLRSLSSGFVRWTAADVRDPERLARLLSAAGLTRRPTRFAHAHSFRG